MRLSMDEARKQHDGIKKLYEQGLRGATASVEQVLDLFDTIEALQQEIEKLKATLADWKYNAKCDADHIAALTIEKDELVEEVQKLEKSDASKEQCIIDQHGEIHRLRDELKRYKQAEQEGWLVALPETGIGDLSDGYHTFNELYHHRAILFSVICNEHPDISWKSKLHHDGTMFDGMFIVGINTPEGQATYHYDINPYWDMFRVRELEKAPEWDGHTSEQAIERIAGLTREAAEKTLGGK